MQDITSRIHAASAAAVLQRISDRLVGPTEHLELWTDIIARNPLTPRHACLPLLSPAKTKKKLGETRADSDTPEVETTTKTTATKLLARAAFRHHRRTWRVSNTQGTTRLQDYHSSISQRIATRLSQLFFLVVFPSTQQASSAQITAAYIT
jgi:hypothetical protein